LPAFLIVSYQRSKLAQKFLSFSTDPKYLFHCGGSNAPVPQDKTEVAPRYPVWPGFTDFIRDNGLSGAMGHPEQRLGGYYLKRESLNFVVRIEWAKGSFWQTRIIYSSLPHIRSDFLLSL